MAHYDEDTQKFMDEVSGEQVARKALGLANAVVHHKPMSSVLGREIVKAIVKEGSTKTIGLYQELNDRYQRLWWDWEPETLWSMLAEHFDLTDELKNKVLALQVCLNTHYPFEHWHIFEKVGHAFDEHQVDFGTLQPLEPDAAALACKILQRLRPKEEFDPEVLGYIAACGHHAGLAYMPQGLFPSGVQSYLDGLTYDYALRDLVAGTYPKVVAGDSALAIQTQKLQEIKERRDRG